jgi:hypothetical protein
MKHYKVTFPFIPDMGSVSAIIATAHPMETARENALWQLNLLRERDGLKPLCRLPSGTVLKRVSV